MKSLIYSTFIFLISFFITSCTSDKKNKEVIIVNKSDLVQKTISVKGMTCVGCEVTLESKISKVKGVVKVKASHNNENAIIQYDSTKTNIKTIKESIKKAGYKPY